MEEKQYWAYCRVSTSKQDIDRQSRNILELYPTARIIKEVFTGTTQNRKEWLSLKRKLKPGDTCVFDSVSRMSRNADEGVEDYIELFNAGIELIFLKEPHINTAVYREALTKSVPLTGTNVDYILEGINKYLMVLAEEQIRIAFDQAEKEVNDLHKRTSEGLQTAKLKGKQVGRVKGKKYTTKKSLKTKEIILKKSKDFGGTWTDKQIMLQTGVHSTAYYKYKKELRDEFTEKLMEQFHKSNASKLEQIQD